MRKMSNPFSRFYNTAVKVYSDSGTDTYDSRAEKEEIGELVCDIQPYTDALSAKLYGADEDIKYKLYCDSTELIRVGRYIRLDGELYRIVSAGDWKLGMRAVISLSGESL